MTTYTCKSCGEKVYDRYQVITEEPYRPVYHVLCYKKIYDKMISRKASQKRHKISIFIFF